MSQPAPGPTDERFPIAIIGSGFSGIATAIQLKKAGVHSFTMFERAGDVGGTWRDNTYPGAACDVPSHVYSLSFEPNANWTRAFSESGEIHAYLRDIFEKWDLRPHCRFNTEIVDARFDEAAGTWTLLTNADEPFVARAVVSCVGGLVDPAMPDIKGVHSFEGEIFHTARWNHDYDIGGRRVGVIGTGASAVQVVPSIAGETASLCVFQRTPAWVVPKPDGEYSPRQRARYARFPWLLKGSRWNKYAMSELFGPLVFLDSKRLSAIGERMSMSHLRKQVRDPVLREKLTPSFQFGCKRILISNDYWATFERENVELVTDAIEEIKPGGIQCVDGTFRPLDAIVFATGFDLGITSAPFPITGRGGRSLSETWARGAIAYKGMEVAGFPNWFILMGPNTGPGHTSVLVYTEAQVAHVVAAIDQLRNGGIRTLEVRQGVQDRYNEKIQGRMKHMVWSSGCNSWYLSPDGGNHSLYPGFAAEYTLRARRFKLSDYEVARS